LKVTSTEEAPVNAVSGFQLPEVPQAAVPAPLSHVNAVCALELKKHIPVRHKETMYRKWLDLIIIIINLHENNKINYEILIN
jgi:hypothetical protein